jgi:TPP-dependent pyruvate/acetoin dehydrogenase alpha subunit
MRGEDELGDKMGLYESLFTKMYTIRKFEEEVARLVDRALVKGPTHVYIGQEAIAAGVCENLRVDDYIVSHHRGHGHCIAKGGNLKKMMAELMGKETGYCCGKGGSMHIADFGVGMLGANGIVGGGIPVATGVALASKLREDKKVTVCFFGDGAIIQGSFYESANFAAIMDLPIIYVCENNLYAVSCHINKATLVKNLSEKALAFGMKAKTIDGNDVMEVYGVFKEAVECTRNESKPMLIECKTYRWHGHSAVDKREYRTREEEEEWKARCPILTFEKKILQEGFPKDRLDKLKKSIEKQIEDAVEFGSQSPLPGCETALKHVFA